MAERLTFVLDGRDNLSQVLGHAGESATRLRATMEDAADGSGQAILTLTQDSDGRLRDLEGRFVSAADAAALMATRTDDLRRPTVSWSEAAERAGEAGEAMRKALVMLAPAAAPAAASLAPIAPAALAVVAAAGLFGLAISRQTSAMGEAVDAERKYREAVEESGASSEEAAEAQDAYARQMAKLPAPTRQAAAALSVFRDEYDDWSDDLSSFTMAPVVKGLGVVQGMLPKATPLVQAFARELDRTVTIAGAGVSSPGLDAFMERANDYTTRVLRGMNDSLLQFLRTAETGQVGVGLRDFLAWSREQGPVVREILGNIADTLIGVLDAATEMGGGMLQVVSILAKVAAAVPPEAIALLLQLAVAIRVVNLAVAGTAAARTALGALAAQITVMRTSAAAAPGPLAAAGAAISGLSRTAKIAMAGTGLGLLVILLSELSSRAEAAPPDVDKLTGSLKQLGAGSKASGEAAKAFGADLGELYSKVRSLTDPSNVDAVQQWLVGWTGWDSTPVKEAKEQLDAVDKALAAMVSSGDADLAAAAARRLADAYVKGGGSTEQFTRELDDYEQALATSKFEQQLAADSMGLFGQQAQQTTAKLDAQKKSADGLRLAIFALNETNRNAVSAMAAFEGAIDAATDAVKENGQSLRFTNGELDLGSDKARKNYAALNDLAGKAEAAASAAIEQGRSQQYANTILDRGRGELIKVAQQMGLNKNQAKALADQILKTPDKTARLKGNIQDLEAKLASAKGQLARVPDARKPQVRAEIGDLQRKLASAKAQLAGLHDRTVIVTTRHVTSTGEARRPGKVGHYAGGGRPSPGEWAWVGEQGPELVQFKGGERVFDHRASMRMAAPVAGRPAALAGGGVGTVVNVRVEGAIDPTATAQQIQKLLIRYQRGSGGDSLGFR